MPAQEQILKYMERNRELIAKAADELRNRPMPPVTEKLFSLFEHTGNRLKYEEVYFLRRKYIAVFAMNYILHHRQQDAEKLEEVLKEICSEECWALPAHVSRRDNPDWRNTIDLFACETAQTLAEISCVLQEVLSKELTGRIRENVFRRVLDPFYSSAIPYGNWEHCHHNWSAVCAGSIGSASIYLMRDQPEKLHNCLERICRSLTHYIAGFSDDGACMEGLGYFTYGMTYFAGFAAQLYEYTDGNTDLFAGEKCSNIAQFQQKCYFRDGCSVSFSDGSSCERFRLGLTAWLAMKYPQVSIPNMELAAGFDTDPCFRWMGIYRDYIWTEKYLKECRKDSGTEETEDALKKQIILPDAQWSICESRDGSGVAAKGGNNDEPHNHNDVGSFLYVKGKELLLTDLGAGEYTKEYFGPQRYEIFCNQSLSHNVPIINGKGQKAGAAYRCDRFETDENGGIVISFAQAYGMDGIKSIIRTIHFNRENGSMEVEDCFEIAEQTRSITENLVTQHSPEISGNIIRIKGKERSCTIRVEGYNTEIRCVKQIHSNHYGMNEEVYLIQWEVPVTAATAVSGFYLSEE